MLVLAGVGGEALVHDRRAARPIHPVVSLIEMERYVADGDVLILDARPRAAYADAHIPRALSLPMDDYRSRAAALEGTLREHRHGLVIVYCVNPWCGQADDLQAALIDLGHRRVGVFPGGFYAWCAAGQPVEKSS